MRNIILGMVGLCLFVTAWGQAPVNNAFEGYWEGTLIRLNATQKMTLEVSREGSGWVGIMAIPDFYPQFGWERLPLNVDSEGNLHTETLYGDLVVHLSVSGNELFGEILDKDPAIRVHLSRMPAPPQNLIQTRFMRVKHHGVSIAGHLHQDITKSNKTAVIIVDGRGCYDNDTEQSLYAKLLCQYGIAVFAYDKRGNGSSTGDCNTATIDELATDVVELKKLLEAEGFDRIGVLGSSAGGWVMVKAHEMRPFDFMIGVVAPSTSVREQQFQSMHYGSLDIGLSDSAREKVETYTKMLFDARLTKQNEARFAEMYAQSQSEGWDELLDDSDVPAKIGGIANLWVRRHAYDPIPVYSTMEIPVLAIYGGTDWIVPAKENLTELADAFQGERAKWLTTKVAAGAGHGMGRGGIIESQKGGESYWDFYKTSPDLMLEIVAFLRKWELINH